MPSDTPDADELTRRLKRRYQRVKYNRKTGEGEVNVGGILISYRPRSNNPGLIMELQIDHTIRADSVDQAEDFIKNLKSGLSLVD